MSLRPINRLPSGLLALLDLQTAGKVPLELGETVVPIVDVTPMYRVETFEWFQVVNATSTFAPASVGTYSHYESSTPAGLPTDGVRITVPQGELWYVQNWSHWVSRDAASTD